MLVCFIHDHEVYEHFDSKVSPSLRLILKIKISNTCDFSIFFLNAMQKLNFCKRDFRL